MSAQQLKALERFSACDVSDALLKLKVPFAGALPGIRLQNFAAAGPVSTRTVFSPVSTVLFAPKATNVHQRYHDTERQSIPGHYVDTTPSTIGHAVLMFAPPEATCAVLGGIMALRMSVNGASAIVVNGCVRDLPELYNMSIPIWSSGTSTVGTGEGAIFWAKDVGVTVKGDMRIQPGDTLCADPMQQGVVVIPHAKIDEVIELLPRLTEADESVMVDVRKGMTVHEAFAKHRSNL